MRYLIVNADDFGLSDGVNRGIVQSHEHGIVTSASLMVRYPDAREAAAYARRLPRFSLGLHIDLGEWVHKGNHVWEPIDRFVDTDDPPAVETECARQLQAFRDLFGADPTHLDSHQHFHRKGPSHHVLMRMSREMSIPLRHFTPNIQYVGHFFGQSGMGEPRLDFISPESLINLIDSISENITEIACHPGLDNEHLPSAYKSERPHEVQTLCDPRVRQAIEQRDIRLISFLDLPM